jgi:hypothetical protein
MPEGVIEMMPEIGSDAVLLYLYLRYRTNRYRGVAWPGYKDMRAHLRWGKTRISNALQKLVAEKLVEKDKRFGASTVYTLLIPPQVGDSSPVAGQKESRNATTVVPEQDRIQDVVNQDEEVPKKEVHSPNGDSKNEFRKEFTQYFCDCTGLNEPEPTNESARKLAGKRWWQPIRRMAELADWKHDVAWSVLGEAIEHMDKDGLTIDAPASVEKVFNGIVGAIHRGAYKRPGEPKGHDAIRSYLQSRGVTA